MLGVVVAAPVVPAQAASPGPTLPAATADGVTVLQKTLVPVGLDPEGVAVGDFTGDGIIDLAVSAQGQFNTRVGLVPGLGGGRFADYDPNDYWSTRGNPGDLVLADFNADGWLDVAVCVTSIDPPDESDVVEVRLGTGGGSFARPSVTRVPAGASRLSAADANGDGLPDLLVAGRNFAAVSVLLSDRSGGFTAAEPVRVGSPPSGLDVGDVDGDGNLDFAVTNFASDSVSILLGQGSGAFPRRIDIPVRPNPVDLALSDMNQDGYADVVVGSNDGVVTETGTVAMYDGRRRFAETGSYRTFAILQLRALDWNEQGGPDIATTVEVPRTEFRTPEYLVVTADPFGPSVETYVSRIVGNRIEDLAHGDVDGDGHQDLLMSRTKFSVAIVFNPLG